MNWVDARFEFGNSVPGIDLYQDGMMLYYQHYTNIVYKTNESMGTRGTGVKNISVIRSSFVLVFLVPVLSLRFIGLVIQLAVSVYYIGRPFHPVSVQIGLEHGASSAVGYTLL